MGNSDWVPKRHASRSITPIVVTNILRTQGEKHRKEYRKSTGEAVHSLAAVMVLHLLPAPFRP